MDSYRDESGYLKLLEDVLKTEMKKKLVMEK